MGILDKLGFRRGGDKMSCQNISAAEAKRLIDEENAKILDVRNNDEFMAGHIKNALLIPVNEISKATEILLDKDEKIIVYCHSGMRSSLACRQLVEAGYTNLYNLKGGVVGGTYGLEK